MPRSAVRSRNNFLWLAGAGVLFSALLLAVFFLSRSKQPDEKPTSDRIAVLLFHDLSDDPDPFGRLLEALGSSLTTDLTKALGPHVVPWALSRTHRSEPSDPDRLIDVARELGVNSLLLGTLEVSEERVIVQVKLVPASTGSVSWKQLFEGPASSAFDLQAAIARATADHLKTELRQGKDALVNTSVSRDQEAYLAYTRAQVLLRNDNRASVDRAIVLLKTAVDRDPGLAVAQLALGSAQARQFYMGWGGTAELNEAEARFKRALAIDPGLQSARRGLIQIYNERGQSEKCLDQGEEALRFGDRDDVETLFVRANSFVFGGLGDLAVPLLQRILEEEPENQGAAWFLFLSLAWGNRCEEALEQAQEYYKQYGFDAEMAWQSGICQHILGDPRTALLTYKRALQAYGEDVNPSVYAWAVCATRALEDLDEEKELLEDARSLFSQQLDANPENFRVQMDWASISAFLGETKPLEKLARIALSDEDPSVVHHELLADHFSNVGDHETALSLLRRGLAAGQYGMCFPLWFRLAVAESILARPDYVAYFADYERYGEELRRRYAPSLQ